MSTITIRTFTIPNYQGGGSTATLRIQANQTFLSSQGQMIMASQNGVFYKTVSCTVAANIITVPEFTIDSTTDSSVPSATYNGILYDSNGSRRIAFFSSYAIPTTFGATANWEQIENYNQTVHPPFLSGYPTTAQVQSLIDAATDTEIIGIAVSDEATLLTAGAAKVTFRLPCAMTLTGVRASLNTAPTGSTVVVDINESGTSVLSTKLSIDINEKTSTTAAVPAVISDVTLADDAEMTIDIDQIGSGVAGAGLKVWLIGYRT
jgi:hypothetical protein